MRVILQLLTPARYLRVVATGFDKVLVDWVLPLLFALAVTLLWRAKPDALPLLGQNGFISTVASFMQMLVGFYVAALAAVATFGSSSLDEDVLNMKLDGNPIKRRDFLSYLFGYLAIVSLGLYVVMLFRLLLIWGLNSLPVAAVPAAALALVFAHQFVFWQMVFITLLGLHYLTDRIHRSNDDV